MNDGSLEVGATLSGALGGLRGPEHLIFFSHNHTPLLTNNVRRRLRMALAEAGIQGITPHSFRRTVATVIDRAGGADLATEILGHTSSDMTKQHYIEPNEQVNPVTAEFLEALAPRRRVELGKPNRVAERHRAAAACEGSLPGASAGSGPHRVAGWAATALVAVRHARAGEGRFGLGR